MENLKDYYKALGNCWEAYKSSNPCSSEYMETDYKHGVEDGWNIGFEQAFRSAQESLREKRRYDTLREVAAVGAMKGLLANPETMTKAQREIEEFREGGTVMRKIARWSRLYADALIEELKGEV